MLILILSLLISFSVGYVIKVNTDPEHFSFWAFSIFAGLIIFALATLITFPFFREFQFKTYEKEIIATKTGDKVEGYVAGSCFYIRGKIEEKDYYFVLANNGNGTYKQISAPVESTVIVETKGTPKIKFCERFVTCSLPKTIRFKGRPKYVDENDTIFVPVGTITNSDMEFKIF